MNRLDSALRTLTTAIDGLEGRLAAKAQAGLDREALAAEVERLKSDCARLQDELNRIRYERSRLQGLNDHVAGRLDTAIREIQAALALEGA